MHVNTGAQIFSCIITSWFKFWKELIETAAEALAGVSLLITSCARSTLVAQSCCSEPHQLFGKCDYWNIRMGEYLKLPVMDKRAGSTLGSFSLAKFYPRFGKSDASLNLIICLLFKRQLTNTRKRNGFIFT